MSDAMSTSFAVPTWLAAISDMDGAAALRFLQDGGQATPGTLSTLADAALTRVEVDPEQAAHWLAIGQALHRLLDDTTLSQSAMGDSALRDSAVGNSAAGNSAAGNSLVGNSVVAQLAYAQARLAVYQGALGEAEIQLRAAQAAWQRAKDDAGAARTWLGLTQVFAMQGRYTEAETAARWAITLIGAAGMQTGFARHLQLAGAHHNLATLYVYTERHRAALTIYEEAQALLQQVDQTTLGTEDATQLRIELAHNELNRASALTFLDQPVAAEIALQQAISYFEQVGDLADRGRAQTNLGRLYLRTGRYAAALTAFDRATADLIGEAASETTVPLAQLRQADELLLEQAMAYLVMNLLPEAEQALARCEALFRSADQPYELGQTLYTWGVLRLRSTEWVTAQPLLAEAASRFALLQNQFWLNRTHLAQAGLAYRRDDRQGAMAILDALLADAEMLDDTEQLTPVEPDLTTSAPTTSAPTTSADPNETDVVAPKLVEPDMSESSSEHLQWDVGGLAELQLLRLRIQIDVGDLTAAEITAAAVADRIGLSLAAVRALLGGMQPLSAEALSQVTGPLPHYTLRLHHLLGRLARRSGDVALAQAHLQQALTILEQQRATLPVEEIRTAFLDDKSEIYVDLIELLLELADEDPTLMAAAFATVERARSRALLERLLAATSDTAVPAGTVDESDATAVTTTSDQLGALRQRLHWLYNQLLGESGSRNLNTRLSEQLLMEEAALQRLEWRRSTLLQQAEPVDLATFQAALADDQQAIVYTILGQESSHQVRWPAATTGTLDESAQGGAEIMAFLIDRHSITAYRHLTTTTSLQQALDELRFQLGRAELGKDYLTRHQDRLRLRLYEILAQLYRLLLAPMRPALSATRLLVVPAGPLHRLPFHALWDGGAYLLANYECSYAPSASVVVMRRGKQITPRSVQSWAGLAVDDVAIPAARAEVTGAAHYFSEAHLFLDEAAGRAGLQQAAQANVLHLATHGLFRPDNPFFSALKLADGWIDVREIYRLPLQAQLVILSACESGAGQIRGGDEVVGLARGFLGAGANEVLASLWNVHDESAVALMDSFYRFFIQAVQERPAAALRAAQLEAVTKQQHPYFWAPFFVIGE